jgi:hypothetical protein
MARRALWIAALIAGSIVAVRSAAASAHTIDSVGPPPGFEELARPHEILVDVYYGGSKVGEARAIAAPGTLRFVEPQKLVALFPDVVASTQLTSELAGPLPAHTDLVCSGGNAGQCGKLSPTSIGIIFDEDRFRVTFFFAPGLLRLARPVAATYLEPTSAAASLTSSVGLAVSGSGASSPYYNLQNRTILSLGSARVRTDVSYASKLGMIVDDLAAEVDRRNLRYSAGLFWAPGLDLTGQRRIVGLGLGTQFDTRTDRDVLEGTPLVLFLSTSAQVDLLVDGRLVTSRAYGAGNNVLDTSALPDGSYPVVLRIREENGSTREEQRFFVKNAQIAPVGEPLYFVYAGMLANTRPGHAISLSRTFYYQAGTARRISQSVALDLSAIGTGNKSMIEAGAWLAARPGRARIAALVSTSGDRAILVQLGSSGHGRLNFSLDARRVWSGDGRPLIPISTYADNFGSSVPTGAQVGQGSYTQISGSIGLNLDRAYLSVTGSLRHDKGLGGDYTIGPSLSWPVISRNGLQLILQADAQRTRTTSAAYLGARFQFTSRRLSVIGAAGEATRRTDDHVAGEVTRAVGSVSGEYFYQDEDRTQVSAYAGYDRNIDSSDVHAGAQIYSRAGSARADILHPIGGRGGVQYAVTLQTGAATDLRGLAIGGRDIGDSALVVKLDGQAENSDFEVLVDGQPRARLQGVGSVPIFLQPYRSYKIRLRPIGATSIDYDPATRSVTLYPGNVDHMSWAVRSLITVFGQAFRPDGRPLANASVESTRGIGETDGHGYFQIDVASGDRLSFTAGGDRSCQVQLGAIGEARNFAKIGKVICR